MSSGNSLDYCQQDWDQMVASAAAMKEMEAAGIAWVSKRGVATSPYSYWALCAWSDMSAASGHQSCTVPHASGLECWRAKGLMGFVAGGRAARDAAAGAEVGD